MATSKSYKDVFEVKVSLNWQEKRSEVREKSTKGKYLRSSLQCLSNDDVLLLLESILQRPKDGAQRNYTAKGLRAVQEHLMYGYGYLDLEEAYHLYSSFNELSCSDKQAFRDKLLDPDHGLPVYVITKPISCKVFVVLKNGSGMEKFLVDFTNVLTSDTSYEREGHPIDKDTLTILLKSMDTEYDRNVLRTVMALCHTRPELYDLGIDPSTARRRIKNIIETANECENALAAGEDLVRLHLLNKQEQIQSQLKEVNSTLDKKRDIWPEKRVNDLEESKERFEERLSEIENLLEKGDKSAVEKVRRAAKRRAGLLLEENRVKRRKLGAHRPTEMDEDEEQYLLKAIEDMSMCHGRRHDIVMYLHHRVKAKDMLRIVNHRRATKGKRPLKAVSTVLTRGKPKRASSIQAKRHTGQSLFCCKKPPKTEDCETELTHHQRAHVKNAVENFCYKEQDRKYALIKSMDDKAYVRPGTSVGFRDTKRGGTFQPSDSDLARKLPKYDWVKEEVYVTPSTHRIFVKEPKAVGNKEAYVMSEDESFVFMRPKAQVGSSGTVWSSEDFELRANRPDLYEVPGSGSSFCITFRSFCTRVRDKVKHFTLTTTQRDVMAVGEDAECIFRNYETKRIEHTSEYLERAADKCNFTKMSEAEVQHCIKIQRMLQSAVSSMNSLPKSANTKAELWNKYQVVITECEEILAVLGDMHLPETKPRVLELTDAGPGVGCSNGAVQYRMAETILVHGLDKVVRVHRARGDSGQNEAERTNASIGDALVTGETLQWEYHKRFEGMSREEINALSLHEYEVLEEQRMKKNAWRAAADLAEQVDGEPAPNGFISCRVTPNESEQFLWDRDHLEKYISAKSETSKLTLPGSGYYSQLERFCQLHFQRGELYIEYVKGSCEKNGELCDFCREWNGPWTGCVPRPYPDYAHTSFHYLMARETPTQDDAGNDRPVDDFQPRAQLKALYKENSISSSDEEKVKAFLAKYVVPENLVRNYILHLEHLNLMKEKRQREEKANKEARAEKKYEEYNWQDLYERRKILSLQVFELDKYIDHHRLSERGHKLKKKDKVSLVQAHIAMTTFANVREERELDLNEASEDEDDIVLNEWGTSENDDLELLSV